MAGYQPKVYRDSNGNRQVVASGGEILVESGGEIDAASGAFIPPTIQAKGHIPLSLGTARIISGNAIQNTTEAGVPDGNTSPSLARVNGATDKMARLAWAGGSAEEIQFESITYPQDLDDASAVTVHILAAMANTNDTPTVAIGYFEGVGDTNAGGNTGAVTGATVAEYSATIAAADVGAHPKAAAITLTPGAHATDALYVYAAWVEYTRKTS